MISVQAVGTPRVCNSRKQDIREVPSRIAREALGGGGGGVYDIFYAPFPEIYFRVEMTHFQTELRLDNGVHIEVKNAIKVFFF